jgi:hypothetical protein
LENDPELRSPMGAKKGKRYALFGVIGALILVAVIIVIVEATMGKKESDGGDRPTPVPGPSGINDYVVDTASRVSAPSYISGVMVYTPPQLSSSEQAQSGEVSDGQQVGVETETIVNAVGVNNNFLKRVRFTFGQVDPTQTVLSLTDDDDQNRFSVPENLVNKSSPQPEQRLDKSNFQILEKPFSFSFTNARTGETMIDTFGQTFIYQDKYIQIDIGINSEHVFGFGERLSKFKLEEGAWTMWPQDSEKVEVDTGSGGKQLEGMHPFCLIKAQSTNEYLGMYFRSTNAQAPVLQRNGTRTILSYITTGGSLDINFFFRGSAKEVIASY